MARGKPFKKGRKKAANSGRKRGVKNKKTIERTEEFKLISDKLFTDQEYMEKVFKRLASGRAQQLERYIWEKRFGKEPLPVSMDGTVRVLVIYEDDWRDLGDGG